MSETADMGRELPSPTPKLPGVITMSDFAEVVLRFVPLEDVRVVMDLGAMDGGDTLELGRLFPAARTIAVEGLPSNFERYLSWLDGIESYCAVIGSREAKRRFSKNPSMECTDSTNDKATTPSES